MLDHVGTHVDAFRHVNPKGKPIDQMPLDLFMGKAVCFDLQQIKDLENITVSHMEEAEKKSGVSVNGHIVLLCTGFHKRNYADRKQNYKRRKFVKIISCCLWAAIVTRWTTGKPYGLIVDDE